MEEDHPDIQEIFLRNKIKKINLEDLHILYQKIVILFRKLYKFSEKVNIAKNHFYICATATGVILYLPPSTMGGEIQSVLCFIGLKVSELTE